MARGCPKDHAQWVGVCVWVKRGGSPADPITDVSVRHPQDVGSGCRKDLFHLNPPALGTRSGWGIPLLSPSTKVAAGQSLGWQGGAMGTDRLLWGVWVEESPVTGGQHFHNTWGTWSNSCKNCRHWHCFAAAYLRPDRVEPELKSHWALSRYTYFFSEPESFSLISISFLSAFFFFFSMF